MLKESTRNKNFNKYDETQLIIIYPQFIDVSFYVRLIIYIINQTDKKNSSRSETPETKKRVQNSSNNYI